MKISITCITPVLQAILDFFPDIISFQHVFHLGVGRSQIEWKLKAKTQISVFQWAKIGQNDHSNPYIESTTVLSDITTTIHVYTLYVHRCAYVYILMRDEKEGKRSKQGHTNNNEKQHSTPKAVTFPQKNEHTCTCIQYVHVHCTPANKSNAPSYNIMYLQVI